MLRTIEDPYNIVWVIIMYIKQKSLWVYIIYSPEDVGCDFFCVWSVGKGCSVGLMMRAVGVLRSGTLPPLPAALDPPEPIVGTAVGLILGPDRIQYYKSVPSNIRTCRFDKHVQMSKFKHVHYYHELLSLNSFFKVYM